VVGSLMIAASITITVEEFDDFLYETIDDLVEKHGNQIAEVLQSFLIGIGNVQVNYSTGNSSTWRF
jgi:hypothetical protein